MLTKEEAEEFLKRLKIMLTKEEYLKVEREIEEIFGDPSNTLPRIGRLILLYILENYTKDDKREIQVGDIYKNKYGSLIEIRDIDMRKECPLRATFTSYRLDGQYLKSAPSKADLDLSKRYELVEVKDVD